jgi:hypothetical protein
VTVYDRLRYGVTYVHVEGRSFEDTSIFVELNPPAAQAA